MPNLKKRILRIAAVLLILALFAVSAPPGDASSGSGVCFVALNDKLLELSSSAYISGGVVYVPYSVFDYFRIFHAYHAESAVASLYTVDKQIFFDIDAGGAYDTEGRNYSASAILLGGQVYVPVSFVASTFDLTWSYIPGGETGDVCRIKNGSEKLNDKRWFEAASSLLQQYYNDYYGTPGGQDAPVTPTPQPGGAEGAAVCLSFRGLPDDGLLAVLGKYGVSACFLLTESDVTASPDAVRRVSGEGHVLGLLAVGDDPAGEYSRTRELVFEAAHVYPTLAASDTEAREQVCGEAARELGLAFRGGDIYADGLSSPQDLCYLISLRQDRADVRLTCADGLAESLGYVLKWLSAEGYSCTAPNELNAE